VVGYAVGVKSPAPTARKRVRPPRTRERKCTDESLRAERQKADHARQRVRDGAARDADVILDEARAVADAVLDKARSHEDEGSRRPAPPQVIDDERARADRKVLGARATAEAALNDAREVQADTLHALLVHERAATDAFLLTERVRSDDAVANRDDFLGMVAHDVRNLLNLVNLSLELLRPATGEPESAQVVGTAHRIRRYVARMNGLIGDLVDITSIGAGKLAMTPVAGDAAALARDATDTFQPAAAEKGLTLTVEAPATPTIALFDHGRLLQVFANLMANAIKFTPTGGKITVHLEMADGELRFCVTDTGPGVPASMLEAVFQRFWQVDGSDRRGQGLGLFISKSIVEAHGGRIWAEDTAGCGGRFYFTLPVPARRAKAAARRQGPRPPRVV
jgi:signal transduction histidine kinase